MRATSIAAIFLLGVSNISLHAQPAASTCGELITIQTHGGTTTRYSLALPKDGAQGPPPALILLPGGGGYLNLNAQGCARALTGNFLVRTAPLFRNAGFATALIDAPSNHSGTDGLKGFRITAQHADDLGRAIADVRKRIGGTVWLIGNSRGTISAANAASRLAGAAAADGLVLTSAITSAGKGGMRPWAVQTVFDLRLEAIRGPVLVVGHAADKCPRTPPSLMGRIVARTEGAREQTVMVTGAGSRHKGLDACGGSTPHGFIGHDAAVVAGISRFIRGGTY